MTDQYVSRMADGRIRVTGHHEAVVAALDASTYSNAVSRYLQVPNGLDGTVHAAARRRLDRFFAPERIAALVPMLRRVAAEVVLEIDPNSFDAVGELGARFAVRAQSAWLGWDPALEPRLLDWVGENQRATASGDPAETTRVAEQFNAIVRDAVATADPHQSVTGELVAMRGDNGERYSSEAIVSVLRNWTGGDLTSIALCTGVIVHWLAENPDHQRAARAATDSSLDSIIDEILRLDDPFVSNRRRATKDTELAGCPIAAGETVVLDWREANRDPRVFSDTFDPRGHRSENIVYGIGVHICPGRELATTELRILTRALLQAGDVQLDSNRAAVREDAPSAGYRSLHAKLAAHA